MEELNRCIFEHTRLFLGTAIDPDLSGKVSIAIFCGASAGEPAPAVAAIRREQKSQTVAPSSLAPVAEVPEEEEVEQETQVAEQAEMEISEIEEDEELENAPAAVAEIPRVAATRRPLFAPVGNARVTESPAARSAATAARERQEQMQFEPVNRGRFEKSEPTIIDGQDLDVPTFMRRPPR
jgi:cell division protein FtsZ